VKICRLLWLLGVVGACLAAVNWPQFRGPNGSGVAETSGLPVEFGPDANVVWKTPLPPGYSSPALSGDRVFVTASDKEKLLTVCLNRLTGKIEWQREAPRARPSKKLGVNTPASPSPVTDGESVYAFFEDFGIVSYAPDGKERWRHALGPFNAPYGMGSSPIVADGKVLLLCDQDTGSFLVALNAGDGHQVWNTARPEATHGFSTPAIYRPPKGPAQAIVSGSYQVAAYSLDTGEKLWWVHGMAWQAKSIPVVDGDRLFVHSWMESPVELGLQKAPPFAEMLKLHDADHDGKLSKSEVPDEEMKKLWFLFDLDHDGAMSDSEWKIHRARGDAGNGLFAIRLGGKGDVTDTNSLWRFEKSLPNIPSPLLYKGVMYVLREGGIMTALDPGKGTVLKQGRIEGALDPYYASPVAGDDKIYTLSQSCKLGVLKAGAEWSVLAVNDLNDDCWATPAIADGRLYVRTQSAMYCFGKKG
jgi:outer membrane protein assembly factor BamB